MASPHAQGKDNCSETTDMSRGFWRKIYAGELTDKRVNALTMGAELTMHRLILQSDDFGNLQGDRDLMLVQTYPRRREVTPEQFAAWLDELDAGHFITFYEADGDHYCHINGWMLTQPPPRNGKRVRRHPEPPLPLDESGCTNEGESGCVQVHPKRNSPDQSQPRSDQDHPQPQMVQPESAKPNGAGGAGIARAAERDGVRGGRGSTDGRVKLTLAVVVKSMIGVKSVEHQDRILARESEGLTPELALAVLNATMADPNGKPGKTVGLTTSRLCDMDIADLKKLAGEVQRK